MDLNCGYNGRERIQRLEKLKGPLISNGSSGRPVPAPCPKQMRNRLATPALAEIAAVIRHSGRVLAGLEVHINPTRVAWRGASARSSVRSCSWEDQAQANHPCDRSFSPTMSPRTSADWAPLLMWSIVISGSWET